MRNEALRLKKVTGKEIIYAQLIEEAWMLRQDARGKLVDPDTYVAMFHRQNEDAHAQLEEILTSNVDTITDAVRGNLHGYHAAVQQIVGYWEQGGPLDEMERKLIASLMTIVREDDRLAARRKILLTLLGGEEEDLKGSKKRAKKH